MNARSVAALALALAACGCKVVGVEEDREMRERRSGTFDAAGYVARSWDSRLVPGFTRSAVDLATLVPALRADPAKAGAAHGGRRASEGAPWTFVVKGEGTVRALDRRSRAGSIVLTAPGAGEARILTGPVVVSTALRDSIPSLRFDEFADQMAFAAVNKALNDKALSGASATARGLEVGDRVRFVGVTQAGSPDARLDIVPIALEPVAAGAR